MSREKVTVIGEPGATPVAPDAGDCAVRVGGAVCVVKLQLTSLASATPSLVRTPVESRAVYFVIGSSRAAGVSVIRPAAASEATPAGTIVPSGFVNVTVDAVMLAGSSGRVSVADTVVPSGTSSAPFVGCVVATVAETSAMLVSPGEASTSTK